MKGGGEAGEGDVGWVLLLAYAGTVAIDILMPFKPTSSVSDPNLDWIRIQSGQLIRIRIQQGKNKPQKYKKIEISCWMFSIKD
jgi:hypothetical protein